MEEELRSVCASLVGGQKEDEKVVAVAASIESKAEAAPEASKNKSKKVNNKTYWKKGTGYGHAGLQSFDVSRFISGQTKKKETVQKALEQVLTLLGKVQSVKPALEQKLPKVLAEQFQLSWVDVENGEEELVLLASQICVHLLKDEEAALALILPLDAQKSSLSVHGAAKTLYKNAKMVLDSRKKLDSSAVVDESKVLESLELLNHKLDEAVLRRKQQAMDKENEEMERQKRIAEEIAAKIKADAEEAPAIEVKTAPVEPKKRAFRGKKMTWHPDDLKPKPQVVAAAAAAAPMADAELKHLGSEYEEKLGPLRFAYLTEFPLALVLGKNPSPLEPKAVKRIVGEYAGLGDNLPVAPSTGVFVRGSEKNLSECRMLITGPEDTPYALGCFVFDVLFPPNYPQKAPKCQLTTTGKNSVRFNPNLYNNGYVCLSLLGTWGADASEQWNPATSSLLQLAVSIQSLILVPQPYFNEPGYESSMGQPAAEKTSEAYNRNIEHRTVEWAMLDILRNPPKDFEDIIRSHFKLTAPLVRKQMAAWRAKPDAAPALAALCDQLEVELSKL